MKIRLVGLAILSFAVCFGGCAPNGDKRLPDASTSNSAPSAQNQPKSMKIEPVNSDSMASAPTPLADGAPVTDAENPLGKTESGDHGWRWIDPERRLTKPPEFTGNDAIKLFVPSGTNMSGEARNSVRYARAIRGDFEIEVRVVLTPADESRAAGLFIFRNDTNYARLLLKSSEDEVGVEFLVREDELTEPVVSAAEFPVPSGDLFLRLERKGAELQAFAKQPGGEWKIVGKYRAGYRDVTLAGIVAENEGAEFPVVFESLTVRPLSPVRR